MSLIEDASRALAPHTRHLSDAIGSRLEEVVTNLREIRQQSDLGRPDTGDVFKHFIVRREIAGPFNGPLNLATNVPNDDPGPALGEDWMIQSICVNGVPNLTPAFTIRTNTGRLIFSVLKEGMGCETPGGDIVLKQGENLVLEAPTTGVYDFTLTVLMRKYRRQRPDAGYGTSNEHYEEHVRTQEHETGREFPSQGYEPEGDYVGIGGDVSPDALGVGAPGQFADDDTNA